MTDPSVRSVGTRANNTTVACPSTVVAGDTILIPTAHFQSTVSSSGFTTEVGLSATSDLGSSFLWKIADSTDVALAASSGSYTLVKSGVGAVVAQVALAVQDADPAGPIRSATGSLNPSNNNATTAVSLASLTGGDLLVWFANDNTTSFQVVTIPAGSTRLLPSSSSRLHAVSLTQASSGTSMSFVGSGLSPSGQYVAGLVALKGVAGPPPVSNSAFLNFIR